MRVDSVFISASGEWKLGGVDVLSNPKDDAAVLYVRCMYSRATLQTMIMLVLSESGRNGARLVHVLLAGGKERRILVFKRVHTFHRLAEYALTTLCRLPVSAADAYGLGLLIHFAFNPNQAVPATAQPPHPPPTAASRGAIPATIFPAYKKLLNPNPKARLSSAHFLELGMSQTAGEGSGFFASNRLVKVCAGLDNFNLASDSEKATLLKYASVLLLACSILTPSIGH